MKTLFALLFWLACLPSIAQSASTFDVTGTLNLIDRPPEATPVEALTFQIRPLRGGSDVSAAPDKDGRFELRNLRPGRYKLVFPMPGRIEVFEIGARQLAPEDFELSANDPSPISIVVSMKSANVTVKVLGLLSGQSDAIALLVPADTARVVLFKRADWSGDRFPICASWQIQAPCLQFQVREGRFSNCAQS